MKLSQHDQNVLAESRLREAISVIKKMSKKTLAEQSGERARARRLAQEAIKLLAD